jgi:hypothetical protein
MILTKVAIPYGIATLHALDDINLSSNLVNSSETKLLISGLTYNP